MELFGFCKGIQKLNLDDVTYSDMYQGYFAKFYDSLVANDNFDLDIYEGMFQKENNKILELACGSGRILIPLLEKGYDIAGVDLSEDMLDILEKKCSMKNLNPILFKDDMCNFNNGIKYDTIILSHISISLLNSKLQEELFYNISNHLLKEGGIFIFNFTDFSSKLMKSEELKPHYYFNNRNQSFAILFEQVNLELKKVFVNLYSEKTENGKVKRYIGTSCKNIIDKNEINRFINALLLNLINDKCIETTEGFIRFYVLQKMSSEK
ncbi:MAG: class I SAM-dependent methyltransferase [Lachnotalea sp.]